MAQNSSSSTSFDKYEGSSGTGGTSSSSSSSSSSGISASSAANVARQKYKCEGLTWMELNPVVLGGVDLLYRSAYKGSGTQVAYTPYNSARSWTKSKSLSGYNSASDALLETDFWTSPRFRSRATGDFAISAGAAYTMKKMSDGNYGIYDASSALKATIPWETKRILALLQGPGGGGGSGDITSAGYSATYATGAGGGGGGFLLLAIDTAIMSSSSLTFYAGPGGAAASSDKTAGSAGSSYTYISSGSSEWIAFSGSGGGKGTPETITAATPTFPKATAGAGGSYSVPSSTYVTVIASKAGAAGGAGSAGTLAGLSVSGVTVSGNAGGDVAETKIFLAGSNIPTGSLGEFTHDCCKLGYSGGAASTYGSVGGSTVGQALCPGGGGSMLGQGGTGSTLSATAAGIGAGGRGGLRTSFVYGQTYVARPGAGGDGVIYLWWPKPDNYTALSAPTISSAYSSGDFTVDVTATCVNSDGELVIQAEWSDGHVETVREQATNCDTVTVSSADFDDPLEDGTTVTAWMSNGALLSNSASVTLQATTTTS